MLTCDTGGGSGKARAAVAVGLLNPWAPWILRKRKFYLLIIPNSMQHPKYLPARCLGLGEDQAHE